MYFDIKIIILIIAMDGKWCTLEKLFFRVLEEKTAKGKYNANHLRNTIHTSDQDLMIVMMIISMMIMLKSGMFILIDVGCV